MTQRSNTVYSEGLVRAAWTRAEGRCECHLLTHNHTSVRCSRQLVWEKRGLDGKGAWKIRHVNGIGSHTLSDHLVLCRECYTTI